MIAWTVEKTMNACDLSSCSQLSMSFEKLLSTYENDRKEFLQFTTGGFRFSVGGQFGTFSNNRSMPSLFYHHQFLRIFRFQKFVSKILDSQKINLTWRLTRRYLSLGASLYIFIDYPALIRSKILHKIHCLLRVIRVFSRCNYYNTTKIKLISWFILINDPWINDHTTLSLSSVNNHKKMDEKRHLKLLNDA